METIKKVVLKNLVANDVKEISLGVPDHMEEWGLMVLPKAAGAMEDVSGELEIDYEGEFRGMIPAQTFVAIKDKITFLTSKLPTRAVQLVITSGATVADEIVVTLVGSRFSGLQAN